MQQVADNGNHDRNKSITITEQSISPALMPQPEVEIKPTEFTVDDVFSTTVQTTDSNSTDKNEEYYDELDNERGTENSWTYNASVDDDIFWNKTNNSNE